MRDPGKAWLGDARQMCGDHHLCNVFLIVTLAPDDGHYCDWSVPAPWSPVCPWWPQDTKGCSQSPAEESLCVHCAGHCLSLYLRILLFYFRTLMISQRFALNISWVSPCLPVSTVGCPEGAVSAHKELGAACHLLPGLQLVSDRLIRILAVNWQIWRGLKPSNRHLIAKYTAYHRTETGDGLQLSLSDTASLRARERAFFILAVLQPIILYEY